MNKTIRNILLLIIACFTFINVSANEYQVKLYSPDGKTIYVYENQVQDYLNVGWYSFPVMTVYAPDDRSIIIAQSDFSAYQKVGWYSAPVTTLYAPDGRTLIIAKSEKDKYINSGWYDFPVTILYAPNGNTMIAALSEVEAYKNVGWYSVPVVEMFADDGRTMIIDASEEALYLTLGWHSNYVITLYSLDGRTINVYAKEKKAYNAVGWYSLEEYAIAKAKEAANNYGYRTGVEFIESFLSNHDLLYSEELINLYYFFCTAWQKEIKCPVAVIDYYVVPGNYSWSAPDVKITLRNLSLKPVVSADIKWWCYDAYGNIASEYPNLYNGSFTGYFDNKYLEFGDVATYTWNLGINEERTSYISYPSVNKIAFADGTTWIR